MKKTLKLEGLDCAACAAKIETAVRALGGVESATVNFMTAKMVIEGDGARMDEIVKAATDIIRKFEPDVVVKKG